MDRTGSDTEKMDRPHRRTHLPPHLDDYEVDYQPIQDPPPKASTTCPSHSRSSSRKTSRSGISSHSRTSRRSVTSTGVYLPPELSSVQTAVLEEKIKQRQFDSLQQQVQEDSLADVEYQRLQTQAKEAQRIQEEALAAKEALSKHLERQRKLQQAETELEVAKLVSSMLITNSGSNTPRPSGSPDSPSPPPQPDHTNASRSPQSTSSSQLPPPLPTVTSCDDISQLSLRPLALTLPTTTVSVSSPSTFPLLQAVLSSVVTVSETAPKTMPLNTVTSAPHVTHQPFSVATVMSTIGQSMSRRGPSVPKQSNTAPLTMNMNPYVMQQSFIPPVSTHGYQQQPPITSQQASAPPPNVRSAQPHSFMPLPHTYPGTELLFASAYGIPQPKLPVFESGNESDFALLKLALDNLLSNHSYLSEQYKYHVLLSHLKLPSAQQLAKAYMYHSHPYSAALQALQDKYGQPRQLVQSELGAIMNSPPLRLGDANAFDSFALSVQSLVGMLRTLEGQNGYELMCGSHVDRLLSKLPPAYRDSFVEYCLSRGILQTGTDRTYTLPDLATWLEIKSQAKRISNRAAALFPSDLAKPQGKPTTYSRPKERFTPVLLTSERSINRPDTAAQRSSTKVKPRPYCPHCDSRDHYLNACEQFKKLTTAQVTTWIREGKRCWRCGRTHDVGVCNLKRLCSVCKELHLTVLHDSVQDTSRAVLMVSLPPTRIYLDRPNRSPKVMLKVVKVLLHSGRKTMETHAVLDDGSERTLVLQPVVQQLQLSGTPELLSLQTIHQCHTELIGSSVSFEVSSVSNPSKKFAIHNAFTAPGLCLAEHHYPVAALQRAYRHLKDLPLPPMDKVRPLLLIGSDMPHLLTPVQPVCKGPPGGPIAVRTQLGWSLQGPMSPMQPSRGSQQCLHIMSVPTCDNLFQHVERLWQVDTLPYNTKMVTRSKQDKEAYTLLQNATVRVTVDCVRRYATPLLRRTPRTLLQADKTAVLPSLRRTERTLERDPDRAKIYCSEISKLESAGYVAKITAEEANQSEESWFIPHHMVHHNGKDRIVFNCSFQHHGQSLNDQLLPGPTLGPSLLGVLLRFRQHTVAISGDIKGMFHQVRLLPGDKSVLRFLWRGMCREVEPEIYEWQVLPFGTTCSPCCAIHALQHHVQEHKEGKTELVDIVEHSFYVDNCLHSVPTASEAKVIVDGLRQLLSEGGFEIRQWACNVPSVTEHLPSDARSASSERWLAQSSTDLQEPTLGLRWDCINDTLGYNLRSVENVEPTLRNMYKTLASQYDPLGFITPFTTRAKVIIQDLWKHNLGWDDPIEPSHLRDTWLSWVEELPTLTKIHFPRAYTPAAADNPSAIRELHVFSDASERAYGSVAYLRTTDEQGQIHITFVSARSRVAPRKCLSVPRLELCAALTGAQLGKVIQTELTLPIHKVTFWSDSTTVLYWLTSESCHYKVFVGTRVAEIQTLTEMAEWKYVESHHNPADHITRGLTLTEIAGPHQWSSGPAFLIQSPDQWPSMPQTKAEPDCNELKKSAFIGTASSPSVSLPVPGNFHTWQELVKATSKSLHGAAADTDSSIKASEYIEAEKLLLAQAQMDSFPMEVQHLKAGHPVSPNSRLGSLAPEYDDATGLIRVGGRLRRATDLDLEAIHPIILDPSHHITKLLIKETDQQLLHPGSERVLAELRRQYWILRGRQAVRKHQHTCQDCQIWRAKPQTPRMADLPPCRLNLYKPPFYSTGVDCFGPYAVKIGRRQEKRWGIIYKCLTTRCVHLDLLEHMDSDAFLLSLRRFIARRGKPMELLCDNGTNFIGGDRELRESFEAMSPKLQEQLAEQKISFRHNPPNAPHFGGTWEREIKSVKTALQVILREQSVPEPVLQTLLVEVENILNSKPLGYVSSDIADVDPVTPNLLLMGRRDASLPQVLYDSSNLLGRRRWRHSQVLADCFWTTFIRQYLPSMQGRQKWTTDGKELAVGQVVLVIDPQLPRSHWPVGTVTEALPGADGRIRVVRIKVKDKTYTRPVVRLIPLPPLEDNDTSTPDRLS
ncbi:uncharacterized protein [Danio rerio]|uniref:Uncharacterized protein n=1 Tax=Danio rerio TaxID=7955 RepID=A0AC58I6H1_DANRE|nr:uncharacterized protein LOC110438201 [Danio rerio]|eukprot:XP_021324382.1 uncharacterized protein LOC110438201 [Danio rerio]